MPIFVTGLREKTDPVMFISYVGLQELIEGLSPKVLCRETRGILFPLKDNLRTLDDEICTKTLNIIL